jgi:large subunit ribosomal protein L2
MLKIYKPTTSTRRHTVLVDTRDLDKPSRKMLKNMSSALIGTAGKNVRGVVTVRHKGGKQMRQYRMIDFKRDKFNISGVVDAIEYDPNRSARIALIKYQDGERRYILAPKDLKKGQQVMSGEKDVPIRIGNAMPLKNIPVGTFVHNVEIQPGHGGIIGRSAGTAIQIQGGNKNYIQLKMQSGEIRLVRDICFATVGEVGNDEHQNIKIGKAGRKRHMGIRPTVRGVAQSEGHPHGGGQGKGGRHGPGGPAKTPWGKKQGTKTRKNKSTDKYIIKRKTTRRRPKVKKTGRTIV